MESVLLDMTNLALAGYDQDETASALVDMLYRAAPAAYLCLSLQLDQQIHHYSGMEPDVDPDWAEEVGLYVEENPRFAGGSEGARGSAVQPIIHLAEGPVWLLTLTEQVRDRCRGAVTLASPKPIDIDLTRENHLRQFLRHGLIVLDRVWLLDLLEQREIADDLTGMASQMRLFDLLEYEVRRHHYLGRPLSLLIVDVDGLETINRRYGRQYGNHLLRKVAGVLTAAARPMDLVARCGPDELAVLLPETGKEGAEGLAESLSERFLRQEFAGGAVRLTVGHATARPGESVTAEGLLRRTQQALEEAKRLDRVATELSAPRDVVRPPTTRP